MDANEFGGEWTLRKLKVLQDYLGAYLSIFHANAAARHLRTIYVDGFAGCGTRTARETYDEVAPLFDENDDRAEALDLSRSSPRIALGMDKDFDKYLFVDSSPRLLDELKGLVEAEFPARLGRCRFENIDVNHFIPEWCNSLKQKDRAVMFLDPYGLEVRWSTLEAIAKTQKVDLWLLFPCSGVLRMLPRDRRPTEAWASRLNELFGTDAWQNEWYQRSNQSALFDDVEAEHRDLTPTMLAKWITKRLATVFSGVVDRPLFLYNRRNSPLFMLTFAAGNPRGAKPACKIANDIINAQGRLR